MLREKTLRHYLDGGCNCAEAMALGARDEYGLDFPEESVQLVSGFGGGMGCGRACGALLGGLSALGYMKVDRRAHNTPGFSDLCAGFVQAFDRALGSCLCDDLRPRFAREDRRCAAVVEQAADVLEQYLLDHEAGPAGADG